MDKDKLKKARKQYYECHGHYPEDEKAKKDCVVCQSEFDRTWKGIKGKARRKNAYRN